MAKNETRRLKPSILKQDLAAFAALQAIQGYAPVNNAFTVAKLTTAGNDMETAQTTESQDRAAYRTARDEVVENEWAFHNLVLGAKDQMIAQFGIDSNEVQSLGLKKKSEYKSPKRNGTNGNGGTHA